MSHTPQSANSNLLSTHNSNLKVAIVHDWLVGGGAELVVEQLHLMYPEAPIYTSYCNEKWRLRLDGKVVTGYLQHWPFSRLRKFIPVLRIWWFGSLKFDNYDLVISSSGAEAKGIKVKKKTLHVNYCHSPTHYYWNRYDEYLIQPGFGFFDPLARLGLKLLVGPLRWWDLKAAQRPDIMIANSTFTQSEIKKYYGRDAVVIHPPVNTDKFKPNTKSHLPKAGFVIAGRQTPYKKVDLAIAACNKLKLPLTVIGDGPQHQALKAMAGPTITFSTNTSDEDMIKYFQSAEGFIFPGTDDFGIVAVEALSAGTPVIACKDGGALDYVIPGKTGEFFEEQTADSLAAVLKNFHPKHYSAHTIQTHAQAFSADKFQKNLSNLLQKTIKKG